MSQKQRFTAFHICNDGIILIYQAGRSLLLLGQLEPSCPSAGPLLLAAAIAKYGVCTYVNSNILIYQEKIIVDKRSKMMYNDDIK